MDHTAIGLSSAIRALREVVMPALDPTNARAREQLRLVIDYIEFSLARLDHLHARARRELREQLQTARELQGVMQAAGPLVELAQACQEGELLLQDAAAKTACVNACTATLAAAISASVRAAGSLDASIRVEIERCVIEGTMRRSAFERAWYLPLGFDPAPDELPPLAELL